MISFCSSLPTACECKQDLDYRQTDKLRVFFLLDHLSFNHNRTLHHSRYHRCCSSTFVDFSRIPTSSTSRSSSYLSENRHPTFFWRRNMTMFILSRSQETTVAQHWEAKRVLRKQRATTTTTTAADQQMHRKKRRKQRILFQKHETCFTNILKMQYNILMSVVDIKWVWAATISKT